MYFRGIRCILFKKSRMYFLPKRRYLFYKQTLCKHYFYSCLNISHCFIHPEVDGQECEL
jgi:hypothetical protein